MNLLESLCSRIAALLQRSQMNADLEDELRSHLEHRADDLERSGLDRATAERRARVEFGGREKYKEAIHRELGGSSFTTLMRDLRFAVRVLRKSPGFAVTAVLTLALAIGANSVVFGVLNALILRPLDVPNADTLYMLQHGDEASSYQSYPDYLDLRNRNHSIEDLVAWGADVASLDSGGDPSLIWMESTTGNYFDALKLKPYLGRYFHASDEHGMNSAPYVVLTYSYWQDHFQGDRRVVGRVVRLNKHPFTVIGVAQPGFSGTLMFFNVAMFVPIVNHAQFGSGDDLIKRDNRWIFMLMGHLKQGVTRAQAIGDLNAVGADIQRMYPRDNGKLTFTLTRPNLYGDYLGRPVTAFMAALMMLSSLILLAACANLGSLFAARAADRSRELALRLALGSSRLRILRGLFTEAILISLAGGSLGLAASIGLLRGLSAWRPFTRWPIHMPLTPDAKVYVLAVLLAIVSGLLFGAVPVKQVLRTNPYGVVKSGSTTRPTRRLGVREVLLVVQIAICAVLVTSSLVAVRGLARSLHSDFGFDVQNSVLVKTDLSMIGYTPERAAQMEKRMMDGIASIPGVESAGLIDHLPLGGDDGEDTLVFADTTTDLRTPNAADHPDRFHISPEYLHAANTTLVAGRGFTGHDDQSVPLVAIVNRHFAIKLFGSVPNALGRYFKFPDGKRLEVTGVVEDGKYDNITEDPKSAIFVPLLQFPSSSTNIVVHSKRDPEELSEAIRNLLRRMDSELPVYIATRYKDLDTMLFPPRMATLSLGVLGMMGAILSITGIFGMAAYSVSKRMKELGIRMALGAQRGEVLRAALGRAVRLLALGSATGLFLGLLASRVLASIVYQATPRDPLVLAGVVLAMALLGLFATWIPAQRALTINPLILLREE
ncbi:ABC transporter permease [Acidobacteria bacterium AB60]|nr:ABC transporter permease [Acidobacteria bacterium AB60]